MDKSREYYRNKKNNSIRAEMKIKYKGMKLKKLKV